MAAGRGIFQRILQIILDTATAEKTKQDAQAVLREATDPSVAQKNLTAIGAAFSNMVGAINRKIAALRQANDEQRRMSAAVRQGADAVNALKVTLAGEHAAQKLNVAATAEQVAEARKLGEETEQLRQETERYTDSVNQAAMAQRKLDAEMARDTAAVEEIRQAHDEQQRLTAATLQGADAVNRLKVTMAGEAAARRLGANATAQQRAEAVRLAQATEMARQAQVRYNAELRRSSLLQRAMANIGSNLLSFATGFFAVTTLIFSAKKLIEYADSWKLIAGRLKLVTDGAKDLARTQDNLLAIANRTRTSYEATAKLFTRISLNAESLGKSQQQILDLTETALKAIQIGGANATEARAGVIQFSQALASGVLRGDEFRSMMENLPGLSLTLQRSLNVTAGELREMAFAGELTADVVIDAILRMKKSVDEDFKSIPVTVGGAFQVLNNELLEFIGISDEGTSASSGFARALLAVAHGIDAGTEALKRRQAQNSFSERMANFMGRGVIGDLRMQEGAAAREAAEAAEAERLRPFRELLERLKSEEIAALVDIRAAQRATGDEVKQLNDLYEEGNRFLDAGNLTIEQRVELIQALARLAEKDARAKTAEQLLKLEDEHIQMLIEAHNLGIATAKEEAQLVAFQRRFTELLAAGNLKLADRLRIEERLKEINEALLGIDSARIEDLLKALKLGIANVNEVGQLLRAHAAVEARLKDGNLALEERLRLTGLVKDLEERIAFLQRMPVKRAPGPVTDERLLDPERFRIAAQMSGAADIEAEAERLRRLDEEARRRREEDRREEELRRRIQAPALTGTMTGIDTPETAELAEIYENQWRDAHESVEQAGVNAAFGVMGAWQEAVTAIAFEGEGLAAGLEALFRGSAAAILGGLAEVASTKVAENIANAFEQFALAAGRAAVFDVGGAAAHTASGKGHLLAAAKWGLVGGVAAAAQGAVAGGSRGGQSGGIPSGARDPAGRINDRLEGQRIIYITNNVDGINPQSAVHQTLVGTTVVRYQNRRGSRLSDGSRD